MSRNKRDLYKYREDYIYCKAINNQANQNLTNEALARTIQSNTKSQRHLRPRSLSAATQHVGFLRRLLSGRCPRHPGKYTTAVIRKLKRAK